jgi:hypothetical protein
MTHFAIICKDTWKVLGYIPAVNHNQATVMGQIVYHKNIVAVLPEDNCATSD